MSKSQAPPSVGSFARFLSNIYLGVSGWKVEGEVPQVPRAVLIANPHTTNWDMPHMLAVAYQMNIRISWMGKHTLFKGMFGPFMEFLGGVPVDRRKANGAVRQVADRINASDGMWLAIPPSGTREARDYWKSGFYHIARTADVPIVCCYLDFPSKTGGIGPLIHPSGDIKADMDKIRAFYADKRGKYPENESRIRLKEEDEPEVPVGAMQGGQPTQIQSDANA